MELLKLDKEAREMLRPVGSIAFVALLCVAAACAPTPGSAPPGLQDAEREVGQAIAGMWREHIAAARGKDLGAVMDIYAPEATYLVPGSADHRGRAAIESMERSALDSGDVLEARHTTLGLNVVGDTAYELGSIVGPVRPVGGTPTVLTFHFVAQWKRQSDGVWRVEHFMGQPE